MKKTKIIRCLASLEQDGVFRNDGIGNLWEYVHEPLGTWRKLSKEAVFQAIEEHLPDEGLLHSDIAALQTELLYSRHFAEPKLAKPPDELLVAVENGVLNLETHELLAKNPALFLRGGLHIKYQCQSDAKDAPCWTAYMQRSLDLPRDANLTSHPKIVRLYESIGLTCTRLKGAKMVPIFIGSSNAGKSVILLLIAQIAGQENCIGLSLQDIYDRFRTDFLGSRQIIIVHEIAGKPIKRLDFLKKFIAGEPLISEAKGRQPVEIRDYARAIMAANVLPVLGEIDQGGAFAGRLLVNVFTKNEIPVEERDPELLQKLLDERDVIFSLALDAAAGLYARKMQFTAEPEGDALVLQYRNESDAIPRFLDDCCEESSNAVLPVGEAYDGFVQYRRDNCLDSGSAISRTVFRNQMAQLGFSFKKQCAHGFSNPVSCIFGLQWRKEASPLWAQKETVASPQMLEQREKSE